MKKALFPRLDALFANIKNAKPKKGLLPKKRLSKEKVVGLLCSEMKNMWTYRETLKKDCADIRELLKSANREGAEIRRLRDQDCASESHGINQKIASLKRALKGPEAALRVVDIMFEEFLYDEFQAPDGTSVLEIRKGFVVVALKRAARQ